MDGGLRWPVPEQRGGSHCAPHQPQLGRTRAPVGECNGDWVGGGGGRQCAHEQPSSRSKSLNSAASPSVSPIEEDACMGIVGKAINGSRPPGSDRRHPRATRCCADSPRRSRACTLALGRRTLARGRPPSHDTNPGARSARRARATQLSAQCVVSCTWSSIITLTVAARRH